MKKSAVIAAALVLVAAAYSGASWYVGMKSEHMIRDALDRANARIVSAMGPDLEAHRVRIDVSEYRRGVFSTHARYTVTIADRDDTAEFGITDHMQHGPFPWAQVRQGSFEPLLAYSRSQLVDTEAVKRWFDAARGAMPLEIATRIRFGGVGESQWVFAPLEWAADDERLSFSGGRIDLQFSNEMRDSEARGDFASLVVRDAGGSETVALKDIVLRSRSTTAADEAMQTHATLEAASLLIADMSDDDVTVEKIRATLESSQKGALVDATLRYDFDRVRVGEIDLGSVTLGGRVNQFNYEAFSALVAEYDAIADEHGAAEGEDFELTEDDNARLYARLVPVLASSPAIALQPVQWRNDKGESSLALSAAFQAIPPAVQPGLDALPVQALRELRFEMILSRAMFLQAFAQTGADEAERQQLEMVAAMLFDQYVDSLEEQGLVQRDGDRAHLVIVYADNGVDVNGQVMSLEEFLLLFSDFLI